MNPEDEFRLNRFQLSLKTIDKDIAFLMTKIASTILKNIENTKYIVIRGKTTIIEEKLYFEDGENKFFISKKTETYENYPGDRGCVIFGMHVPDMCQHPLEIFVYKHGVSTKTGYVSSENIEVIHPETRSLVLALLSMVNKQLN